VIWKGGDEEVDDETTRSESLDEWNKIPTPGKRKRDEGK
jgi:hypothetical protein